LSQNGLEVQFADMYSLLFTTNHPESKHDPATNKHNGANYGKPHRSIRNIMDYLISTSSRTKIVYHRPKNNSKKRLGCSCYCCAKSTQSHSQLMFSRCKF
jgi:hypothetical protein